MKKMFSKLLGQNKTALFLILLAGLVLRLYNFTSISLWHDEAFSALLIRYPWGEMIYRIGLDVHPPLYYVALRFWHYIFGDTLYSLRGMSVFFGTGTIFAGYIFVKQAFKNEKMALWAAVLIALSPFQVQYVTEARMYTMGAFFVTMAAYFLVKGLNDQKEFFEQKKLNMPHLPEAIKLRKSYFLSFSGFWFCTSIVILTHYYLLFSAAALCFYGLLFCLFHYKTKISQYFLFIFSSVLVGVSFLPWLKIFLFQLHQVGASYWIPKINIWSIPSTFWTMLLGFSHDVTKPLTQKLIIIATLFTIYFCVQFYLKIQQKEKILVLLALLAPFFGSLLFYLISIKCIQVSGGQKVCSGTSVFLERYFLYASSFYLMALAGWLSTIYNKNLGKVLLVLFVVLNLVGIANYWNDLNISERPGMSGAAKYLQMNVSSTDKLYIGTSFEFFNYKYYRQTYFPVVARPLLFTGGTRHASEISHFAGSAILTDSDLVPNFKDATKNGDTVWLIWTYAFGSNKPEIPNNWTQLSETNFGDVRPYVGTTIYVTQYKVN